MDLEEGTYPHWVMFRKMRKKRFKTESVENFLILFDCNRRKGEQNFVRIYFSEIFLWVLGQ